MDEKWYRFSAELSNAAADWYDMHGDDKEGWMAQAADMWRITREHPTNPVPAGHGFWLYRLYAPDHRLIYVGITKNPRARLSSHRKRFGALLDHWWFEGYDSHAAVLEAEALAIDAEHPAFNITHPWVGDE